MTKGIVDVILQGRGAVKLRPNDHVATGGEGSIYRVADSVVKVYTAPEKMRQQGLPDKIKLLSGLCHPFVVSPSGLATTPAGDPIGYYMPFVEGPPASEPLSRVFTNEFYKLRGFTAKAASVLVDRMRETFLFAHQHGATMVDPNELNWFTVLSKGGPEPRVVDVDSWAIGRWPATVIMPSIRDWHTKTFGEETDWFAWAIITFQIYTGIHPFKGTLDGYGRADLEGRMKANASVFTPGVRLNLAVRDFSCIPRPLFGWYEATFQTKARTKPPSAFDVALSTAPAARVLRTVTTSASGSLTFEKISGNPSDSAARIFPSGLVLLASGMLVDLKTKQALGVMASDCEVVLVNGGWLCAEIEHRRVVLRYVPRSGVGVPVNVEIAASHLLRYENRLFVVMESGLSELKFQLFGTKPIVTAGTPWGIIVNSMKWFQGFGILDSMGSHFVVAPFAAAAVAQVRVPELDGLQVVAGMAGNRFIAMVAVKPNGDYEKIELTFDAEYRSYRSWTGPVDGPELNLAILPKGVCATITQDGELTVFVPTNGNVTKIQDRQISTDMLLANWDNLVVYIQGGDVWSVRTK